MTEYYTKEDVCEELNRLIEKLEATEHKKDCWPRKLHPVCPPRAPPEPLTVPHPLVPQMDLKSKARGLTQNVKVTVDGRLAEVFEPRDYYFDEPPLRLPPWVRPRIPSVELRGGFFHNCQCWKKDGLSDACYRWDCDGRPECTTKPLPQCPPGFDPPMCGVRKGNAMVPPLMRKAPRVLVDSIPPHIKLENPPPNQMFIPCPIHHEYVPVCKH